MPAIRQSTNRRSRASRRNASSRLEDTNGGLQRLFSGTSVVCSRNHPSSRRKAPRPHQASRRTTPPRPVVPCFSRPLTTSSVCSEVSPCIPDTPLSFHPITGSSLDQHAQSHAYTNSPRPDSMRIVCVDPAEQQLANLAHEGRIRRRKKQAVNKRWGPKIKDKKIRSKIWSSVISGLFLTTTLTIYLGLALSDRVQSEEFHVLLILFILITTIFFCHSLIRLCMLVVRVPENEAQRLPAMTGPGSYANPVVPIRVALARDEEAAGIECEATKYPPPAYGLWRESVRVDPNRIFWQRNKTPDLEAQDTEPHIDSRTSSNRPPSYVSEDGVDYVLEAQPRSTAPTVDVPLPSHPAERGRSPVLYF